MKRLILGLVIAALLLTGCKPLVNDADIPKSFTVYASFYPIYALAALIIDEDIPGMNLRQLAQPQDGCLRDYTLSDWDSYLLSRAADAVIWGGGGLESFADMFYTLGEDGPAVATLMSTLVLKNGAQDEGAAGHFAGVNPWLFLSVDGAEQLTEAVCANMMALDEPYAAQYMRNMEEAYERFEALKAEIEGIFAACDRSVPVALMHEGLIYFADEWGLNVVCAIEHESGVDENESWIDSAAERLNAAGARVVLIERQAPAALVSALQARGFAVALIDTLSTGREDEGAAGYFIKMRENARRAASVLNQSEE